MILPGLTTEPNGQADCALISDSGRFRSISASKGPAAAAAKEDEQEEPTGRSQRYTRPTSAEVKLLMTQRSSRYSWLPAPGTKGIGMSKVCFAIRCVGFLERFLLECSLDGPPITISSGTCSPSVLLPCSIRAEVEFNLSFSLPNKAVIVRYLAAESSGALPLLKMQRH